MVVDYQVPAEYVGAGYEVLNDEGRVIKVVPRKLSQEERQAHEAGKNQELLAMEEQERLRKWDESLLLRYSTVADIEATRDRALGELRIRMTILQGNRRSLKQKVERLQAQAADLERSGAQVDVARLSAIEDLQSEIGTTDRAIAERQREIEEEAAAYQADIERFESLLDRVKLRHAPR